LATRPSPLEFQDRPELGFRAGRFWCSDWFSKYSVLALLVARLMPQMQGFFILSGESYLFGILAGFPHFRPWYSRRMDDEWETFLDYSVGRHARSAPLKLRRPKKQWSGWTTTHPIFFLKTGEDPTPQKQQQTKRLEDAPTDAGPILFAKSQDDHTGHYRPVRPGTVVIFPESIRPSGPF